jgi:hypothetical protein
MDQDSNVPVPKVQAVGWAGSAATLILLVGTLLGIDIPADKVNEAVVGIAALVSLVTFLAGYFKKSNVKDV